MRAVRGCDGLGMLGDVDVNVEMGNSLLFCI